MARQVFANQATAAKRRVYFHITDATDGLTPETGEAGGQPQVSSDGAAFTNTGIGTLTHLGNGRYYADLTQTLVATAGVIIETRYKSAATCEAVGDQVHVVAYDPDSTTLGLATLAANVTTWAGTAVATPATAGYPVVTHKVGTGTGEIALSGGNVPATVAGAVASVTGAVGSVTGNVGGSVASVTGAVGSVTGSVGGSVASVTGAVGSVTGSVGSVTGAVGSVAGDVAGKVLGGGAGTMTAAGVRAVDGSGNAVAPASTAVSNADLTPTRAGYLDKIGTPAGASLAVDIIAVKAQTVAIQAKTDLIPASPATAAGVTAVYDRVGAPAGASVSADVAAVKAETATIQAKTTNLPSDPADESALEAVVAALDAVVDTVKVDTAAIKLKTDNLPSDPADQSLLVAEHDATQAAIAALNNLSSAQAQSAAAAALTAQGYTTARAPLLDHLDANVSSVGGGSITEAGIATAVVAKAVTGQGAGTVGAILETLAASAPTGAYSCRFLVETAAHVPVDDALVAVYDSGGTSLIWSGRTGPTGHTAYQGFDAATYSVVTSRCGYSVATAAVTISAAGTTTLTATAVGSSPAGAGQCTVLAYVKSLSGTASTTATLSAKILEATVSGGYQLTGDIVSATASAGLIQLVLEQGAHVLLDSPALKINDVHYVVPSATSQDLTTWTPVA